MKKFLIVLFLIFNMKCQALTVKDFYGLSKEVNSNTKVSTLKNNISSYFKVSPNNQLLYLNGLPLKENDNLSKIKNDSIIYLYNKKDNYTYPIKVLKKGLGKIVVDSEAKVSSNIYIKVIPDNNYYSKSIEVLDFEGKKITLEDNRFTMPFGIVNIKVVLEEKIKETMSNNYQVNKQMTFLIPSLIFLVSIILSITIKIKSSKLIK